MDETKARYRIPSCHDTWVFEGGIRDETALIYSPPSNEELISMNDSIKADVKASALETITQ